MAYLQFTAAANQSASKASPTVLLVTYPTSIVIYWWHLVFKKSKSKKAFLLILKS